MKLTVVHETRYGYAHAVEQAMSPGISDDANSIFRNSF